MTNPRPISARKCPKRRLRQACFERIHKYASARELVHATLAQHGCVVRMDVCEHQKEENDDRFPMDETDDHPSFMESSSETTKKTSTYITEEELWELMQEVEDEMQRALVEQVDYQSLHEDDEDALERQIDDFDKWQGGEFDGVMCPVCMEARLLETPEALLCPHSMDGSSCNFRLLREEREPDLLCLQNQLFLTIEGHGLCTVGCPGQVCFAMNSRCPVGLVAHCTVCDWGRILFQ